MITRVCLLPIKTIKAHEKTSQKHVRELKEIIKFRGYFTKPVVVERRYNIILDGHHRVKALEEMGYKKVPVFLVDYDDKSVRVFFRRHNINKLSPKQTVIKTVKKCRLLPIKTTRHLIPNRPRYLNISLAKLVD